MAMPGIPDVTAMEKNLASKMGTRRPAGWSRGKAAWKQAGGLPPGLAKMRPRPKTPRTPGFGEVTGNV